MILLGELLTTKFVELDHLSCKVSCCNESFRVKDNLSDQSVVRNHHTDRSEKRFQVVWKLCSSSVSGVHCDKDSKSQIQGNHLLVELELGQLGPNCALDGEDLLSNNREHLNINSVKLVEATPCSALSKTTEESSHHFVIKTVGAVEHDALNSKSFSQIFCCLCLACSCWSLWVTTKVQVKSTCEGHVTLISQRGDNETRSISEVLVSISKPCVCLASEAIIKVFLLLPVVSQLLCPFEVVDTLHSRFDHVLDDLSGVDVNDNKGTHH